MFTRAQGQELGQVEYREGGTPGIMFHTDARRATCQLSLGQASGNGSRAGPQLRSRNARGRKGLSEGGRP